MALVKLDALQEKVEGTIHPGEVNLAKGPKNNSCESKPYGVQTLTLHLQAVLQSRGLDLNRAVDAGANAVQRTT
ncbi:MAG: hypothetical protein CMA65_06395 [Euryarchaeota archaeon]|nr:hypothetical protein [Euryarchaeota archaeon]